jgi:Predicted acetyltransferase involved in intracellular survival and related acetyltransferases
MIQFASKEITPVLCRMWKTCFDDTDEFIELYFSEKYKPENTLIYIDKGEIVSSLQMLPYTITFYGEKIPFYYLSGLCTLPKYRSKGYMKLLVEAAHNEMKKRGIPLSILIPADETLYDFYKRYGYEQVFEKDENPIALKQIIAEQPRLEEAYATFDNQYQQKDFCVQKTLDDFKTIVREFEMDGCPPKTNLSGMACILDADYLFRLYKLKNPTNNIEIVLCESEAKTEITVNTLTADIRMICRLLFGYKTSELSEPFTSYFPEQKPILNLMLE